MGNTTVAPHRASGNMGRNMGHGLTLTALTTGLRCCAGGFAIALALGTGRHLCG
jgi:hypothetical protein